ncbi:MAG: hypothetical protein V4524_00770 [Patescibacteria group bacterium]
MNDLLELTSKQREFLRLRIAKWYGLVRVFVHPMFERWHFPPGEYSKHPDHKRLVEIEKALSRLVTLPERKTPPIIIMEEDYRLENLKNWLAQNPFGQSQRNVYYVRTWKNTSHPLVDPHSYYPPQWEPLVKRLGSVGVKKILMGGMQFTASAFGSDWTGKRPRVDYCVGIALSYLSNDKAGKFNVDLSALVDCSRSREFYIQCVNETRLKKQIQIAACP